MLKQGFEYLDTAVNMEPPLTDRCSRTVFSVASAWTVVASVILFFAINTPGPTRACAVAFACLVISAAIYSVALPLKRTIDKYHRGE